MNFTLRTRAAIVLALAAPMIGSMAAVDLSPAAHAAVIDATTAPGIWSPGTRPAVASVSDTGNVEVGVKFTVKSTGTIYGIEFYKGSANTGTHVGTLWDSKGAALRTTTFTSETASGWQYAAFSSPIKVTAGTTLIASYHTSIGRYAATDGYYSAAQPSYTHLTPTASVYRYGPRAFPSATSTSNYWVDVRFTADATSASTGSTRPLKGSRPTVTSPLPTATTSPTPTNTPAPTSPATTTPPAGTTNPPQQWTSRDKFHQPFSSTSIWNMPIGSAAKYQPLNMTAPTEGYATDEVYLAFDQTAPKRRLIDRGYWWPYMDANKVTGTYTGIDVHVPDNWIVPPPSTLSLPNRPSAALQSDGKAREFQYTVRPTAGSDISFFESPRSVMDLTGDGLTGPGNVGGHGGAGMTGIGGTIREGELTGQTPIRHALALTFNMRKWGTKQGGNITDGYRWPAITADLAYGETGYATGYGTLPTGTAKDGVGMGTLLAIPASVDLNSLGLETEIGRKLAWTHQNYGAYIVDNSGDDGKYDVHRLNVEDRELKNLPSQDDADQTAYRGYARDMDKIFRALAVVDNNSPTSIGGGGTPLQPLAPPVS